MCPGCPGIHFVVQAGLELPSAGSLLVICVSVSGSEFPSSIVRAPGIELSCQHGGRHLRWARAILPAEGAWV